MAASILKGMNFPSLVSSAEIDAASAKVVAQANCTVRNRGNTGNGSPLQTDGCGVAIFPAEATSILGSTPILEELNDYRLKVTDCPPEIMRFESEANQCRTNCGSIVRGGSTWPQPS